MVAPIPRGETAEAVFASAAQLDGFAPSGLTDLLGAVLANRPIWHRDAACQEHPEVSWFPTKGEDVRPAKAVCATCLVKAECRAWALEQGADLDGIWSGLTNLQRKQMRASHAALHPGKPAPRRSPRRAPNKPQTQSGPAAEATGPPGRSTTAA